MLRATYRMISLCGCHTAITVEGDHPCAIPGHENTRVHSRGSEGGLENGTARLFPHPVLGGTVARAPDAGLDERKQAGLLAPRSSYPLRLTAKTAVAHEAFVLVTAALPRGIHTRFPILPKPWLGALVYVATHYIWCCSQRTIRLIDISYLTVKPLFIHFEPLIIIFN